VDTALAACFGFVLIAISDDSHDFLTISSGLCGMVLLKQSGLILCGMAFAFSLWGRNGRRTLKGSYGKGTLCWLSPLFIWASWMLLCKWKGLYGIHAERTFGNLVAMLTGNIQMKETWDLMFLSFRHALIHLPTTEKLLTAVPCLPLPKLIWILLLIGFPLLLRRFHGSKPMLRLNIFSALCFIFYLVLLLGSFFTTFYNEVHIYSGVRVNNFSLLLERYLAPPLMGVGMLELWLAAEFLLSTEFQAKQKFLTAGILAALFIFCTNWRSAGNTLIPSRQTFVSATQITEDVTPWIRPLEDRMGVVILIGAADDSKSMGERYMRYAFAPARFILSDGQFDDSETLQDRVRTNHITHIICLDEDNDLFTTAAGLTGEGRMDIYTLYAVEEKNGLILFHAEGSE